MLTRRDAWPLGAVGFVLAVSVAWWAFALWPVPGAPEWLERSRSVCFNLTESGLPDTKGWLLLVGQPPTMLALLLVGWGEEVLESLRRLVSFRGGRLATLATATTLVTGLSLASVRVMSASTPSITWTGDEVAPESYPRLDRPWPEATGLVDQSGASFDVGRLRGQPALVTFAFGHCETLCPAVVHQSRATRLEVGGPWPIVVFTLDPWRDTPSRLPALVEQFELDPARDFVVSGSVEDVTKALDAWQIPRQRDPSTGDVTHPAIVYLIDEEGRLAFASTGGVRQMVSLARRLE